MSRADLVIVVWSALVVAAVAFLVYQHGWRFVATVLGLSLPILVVLQLSLRWAGLS